MRVGKLSAYWFFFLISLGLAFIFAHRDKNKSQASALLHNIESDELASLVYKDANYQIKIIAPKNDFYWAQYQKFGSPKKDPKKNEKKIDYNGLLNSSNLVVEQKKFRLKQDVDELIKKWAELPVIKIIGKSEDLDLGRFGLKDSKASIVISDKKGNSASFSIGQQSFKSPYQFVINEESKEVLLIAKDLIDNLVTVRSRFFQASIFSEDEANRLIIESDAKVYELESSFEKSKETEQLVKVWRYSAKPTSESINIWAKKLFSLRVTEYQELSEEDLGSEYQFLLKLDVFNEQEGRNTFSLYKKNTKDGHEYWIKPIANSYVTKVATSRIDTLLSDFTINFKN